MIQVGMIGVVGASGFVGQHLMRRIADLYPAVALTRTKPSDLSLHFDWRPLDLFSAESAFNALKGVDTAVYLVHSMMPSSRLFQGDFHDTDLLLADNFARACVANQVRRIIYLSGVMPEGYVSPHLQSRLEVENVFKATRIPVTVLRAGMIVGPGGSSFEILKTLVQRLPFMILPAWTLRTTQAVFIDDVVDVFVKALVSEEFVGKTLDVVNGEELDYETLLRQMAVVLNVNRPMISLPIQSTRFSKLWVRIFGNSTKELVSPLIDSLLCDLPQISPSPLIAPLIQYRTFKSMAAESLFRDKGKNRRKLKPKVVFEKSVRSIQRLTGIPMHNSRWIVDEYMDWLPRFLPFLIRIRRSTDRNTISLFLFFLPFPLLILKYAPGGFEDDRQQFDIVGGMLTKTTNTGWLEFRQVSGKQYTLAAIHGFIPALPWPIYRMTQAILHKLTMSAFDRHLKTKLRAQ